MYNNTMDQCVDNTNNQYYNNTSSDSLSKNFYIPTCVSTFAHHSLQKKNKLKNKKQSKTKIKKLK